MSWISIFNPANWGKKDPEVNAYCLRCKQQSSLRSIQLRRRTNGRVGIYGRCPLCSKEVTRLATVIEKQQFATTLKVS